MMFKTLKKVENEIDKSDQGSNWYSSFQFIVQRYQDNYHGDNTDRRNYWWTDKVWQKIQTENDAKCLKKNKKNKCKEQKTNVVLS